MVSSGADSSRSLVSVGAPPGRLGCAPSPVRVWPSSSLFCSSPKVLPLRPLCAAFSSAPECSSLESRRLDIVLAVPVDRSSAARLGESDRDPARLASTSARNAPERPRGLVVLTKAVAVFVCAKGIVRRRTISV
eukprot:scaffold1954_cov268-Pinguiococcus_pyrenoidosus.AAC.101